MHSEPFFSYHHKLFKIGYIDCFLNESCLKLLTLATG